MLLHDKLKNYHLILASQSPRRRQLLADAGIEYSLAPRFECEELYPESLPAVEVAEYLSRLKSEAYPAPLADGDILLTADTVVVAGGEVLGKPADAEDALRMLKLLSGREHQVHTGVCLYCPDGRYMEQVATTSVTFLPVGEELLRRYIATGEPMDKAGAYAIQGRAGALIASITGSPTNVIGLPLEVLTEIFQQLGLPLF